MFLAPPPLIPQFTVPPPPPRALYACDVECYRNYFLVKFKDVKTKQVVGEFESFPGQSLDIAGLVRILQICTIVTFNGNNYDVPMITAALSGYDNAQLKFMSDAIIKQNLKPWDFEREFNIIPRAYIDHIDMIEVSPGIASLKMYGGKMHTKRIQDLPIDPDANIEPHQRSVMRDYCGNDLTITAELYEYFEEQIELRKILSDRYDIDLRSKSDAQIAEAVFKKQLSFRVDRPQYPPGYSFKYQTPAFIKYQTPLMQQLLAMVQRADFALSLNGTVVMPVELETAKIKIGNSTYRMGIGGLHSTESSAYHLSNANAELSDHDVISYYPNIILLLELYPPQIGPAFLKIFRGWTEERIAAKLAKLKKKADGEKTKINGTFGKTGSPYSILFAPHLLIQTTITGQLCLLMLIESLELCGISVVSANTDGVVINCPHALTWLRDEIVKYWEHITGFETESVKYRALFSRDVNSYIAFKAPTKDDPNPAPKLKGAYAPPVPVGPSWPNPTGEICVDAIIAYLEKAIPLEQTIRACTDIRKFVHIRQVKGGGVKHYGVEIESETTVRGKRAQLTQAGYLESTTIKDGWVHQSGGMVMALNDAHKMAVQALRQAYPIRKEYLGKAVRWYYAAGEVGTINYRMNGNKVARTEGAKPLMELPDTLPTDIDYQWYVTEAKSLLTDLGVAAV